MNPTQNLSPDDELLRARMQRSAVATAERTVPWPSLDAALHRTRRRRQVRLATAGLVVAAVVGAAVLPFTAVRVEPLDAAATALGLRTDAAPDRRQDGLIQPDVDPIRQGVTVDGAPLPTPGGEPVEDDAWLAAAAQRARSLVVAQPARRDDPVVTIWARDDGTTVRVVVGFYQPSNLNLAPTETATLAGPSGGAAATLELSSVSRGLRARQPVNRSIEPGLVAVSMPEVLVTEVQVAGLPSVGADGIRTTTWHPLTRSTGGLWVGDLGAEGAYGYQYRYTGEGRRADIDFAEEAWWGERVHDDSADTTGLSPVDRYLRDTPLSAAGRVGYGGTWAQPPVILASEGDAGSDPATNDVRLLGVRSPGGGWLVTGEVRMTAESSAELGDEAGDRVATLPTVAAPAAVGGRTPFVGLTTPFGPSSRSSVFLWAPDDVVTVRHGTATAPVTDGLAILKVPVPEATPREFPGYRIQVEGLDRDGRVIARTWVESPDVVRAVA